ncbi:MAG: terminase family protein, partial [Gemmataceae bacterium]|nr:terminase family protein [Gemmataceae bacterium]
GNSPPARVTLPPMDARRLLSAALDPAGLLAAQGIAPDPWQRRLLLSSSSRVLLCCSRQAGKSTVVSALALHAAMFKPHSLVLLLSPSLRQSEEIFRKVVDADNSLGRPLSSLHRTQLRLEYVNGSRILCLPGREETLRGFSGVSLLVIDEAARVPDDLYRSVRPMLAVSQGRLVALSTPFGQRGWFWREWAGDGPWERFRIPWQECPRIAPAFIEEERRSLGDDWVAQEYETSFASRTGLVYPDFAHAITDDPPPPGALVGGIDFGWTNPFAAVWGRHTKDDALWIVGERYRTRTLASDHADALKALGDVRWFADPASPSEIEEFRLAGLKALRAPNAIAPGIAAVTARLQTGRLRIVRGACPQLLREACLYRYPDDGGETPVDEDNHALAALRYLVAGLDKHFMARARRSATPEVADLPADDSHLWTIL